MKVTSHLLPLLVLWIPGTVEAQTASPAPIRDAATHDELASAARALCDPMAELRQVETTGEHTGPAMMPKSRDLVASSDILCNLGVATLLPKRALLYVPKRLQSRLKLQPNAHIRTFPEFARLNRTWLRTFEVTQAQAQGSDAIDAKLFEKQKTLGQVIVATFHGGPISVLPPRKEGEKLEAPGERS